MFAIYMILTYFHSCYYNIVDSYESHIFMSYTNVLDCSITIKHTIFYIDDIEECPFY